MLVTDRKQKSPRFPTTLSYALHLTASAIVFLTQADAASDVSTKNASCLVTSLPYYSSCLAVLIIGTLAVIYYRVLCDGLCVLLEADVAVFPLVHF